MEFTGFMPPNEFWAMHDQLEHAVRQGAGRLPLYQLEDWVGPLMLGSWQMDASEGGVVHGNAFPQGLGAPGPHLEVITTNQDPFGLVRNRWGAIAGPPVSLEEFQRQEASFRALKPEQIPFTVDGNATDFTFWAGPDYWFAAGSIGGFGVVIDARGNPPERRALSLRRVPDVEPLLQARREALKALRGEA